MIERVKQQLIGLQVTAGSHLTLIPRDYHLACDLSVFCQAQSPSAHGQMRSAAAGRCQGLPAEQIQACGGHVPVSKRHECSCHAAVALELWLSLDLKQHPHVARLPER